MIRRKTDPDTATGEDEAVPLRPLYASSSSSSRKGKGRWLATSPRSRLTWMVLGMVALTATIGATFGIYWITLYFKLLPLSPPDSCPVKEWKYPWCASNLLHNRELPPALTPEQWLDLRQRYVDAVGPDRSTLAEPWKDLHKTLTWTGETVHNHGFEVPLEIQNSPTKGRGLFAAVDIPKGTKVWDNRYRGVFPDECSARIFYNSLTNQQACDAMFWGYVNNFYGKGFQYMLDLDGHGYLNHGTEAEGDRNIEHHFLGEMETSTYALNRFWGRLSPDRLQRRNTPGAYGLYATRDIHAGEELCYDYKEIYMLGLFDWYSFLVSHSLPVTEWMTI